MRPFDKAAAYDFPVVAALKALARGEASADQQKRALTWIVERVAETYEPNVSADAHAMAICEGRRSVGVEIARLVNMPPEIMEALRGKNG